ncbi:hypothetical protein MKX01_037007 [Papaver californicum]|nr:hypothetical protein MKX01_037007 [Papaver californicum]
MPTDVNKHKGGNGASNSAEVTDRLVSIDGTRAGIQMQFKSSTQRILSSVWPFENSVINHVMYLKSLLFVISSQ